jgi:hypothetical protein
VVRVWAQDATTTAQGFMGQSQGVPGETVRRLLEHACRLLCKLLNDVRPPALPQGFLCQAMRAVARKVLRLRYATTGARSLLARPRWRSGIRLFE